MYSRMLESAFPVPTDFVLFFFLKFTTVPYFAYQRPPLKKKKKKKSRNESLNVVCCEWAARVSRELSHYSLHLERFFCRCCLSRVFCLGESRKQHFFSTSCWSDDQLMLSLALTFNIIPLLRWSVLCSLLFLCVICLVALL